MIIAILIFAAVFSAFSGIICCFLNLRKRAMLKKKLFERCLEQQQKFNRIQRLNSSLLNTVLGQKLVCRLTYADITMNPAGFVALVCIIALGFYWIIHLFLAGGLIIDLCITAICLKAGLKKFFRMRADAKNAGIDRQLPEICRTLAGAVKAGFSIQQGLEMVSERISEPAGSLFRRLSRELKLGVGLEQAISNMALQSQSKELKLFNRSLVIQHKSGGNLARTLEEMAQMLEMRKRINREILANTSEARFVAMILPFMPLAALLILNMIIPGFLKPLHTLPGIILAFVVAALLLLGFTMIKKVTSFRV